MIWTERHAARLKPEPPFDEGREAIARRSGGGGEGAQLPRQTHEDCGASRKNNSCSEASPSLGTTEERSRAAIAESPDLKRDEICAEQGGRNEIGSRGFKSQALQPRCGRDASRKANPVQKGQSNLFLGGLYALTTAALLATQAPFSFLAAKELSVAVFIGVTELVLLLCVPFMLRTRRSREHFLALLSSVPNLVKFGVLLLIGLIGKSQQLLPAQVRGRRILHQIRDKPRRLTRWPSVRIPSAPPRSPTMVGRVMPRMWTRWSPACDIAMPDTRLATPHFPCWPSVFSGTRSNRSIERAVTL
jgi:hypothetical protein